MAIEWLVPPAVNDTTWPAPVARSVVLSATPSKVQRSTAARDSTLSVWLASTASPVASKLATPSSLGVTLNSSRFFSCDSCLALDCRSFTRFLKSPIFDNLSCSTFFFPSNWLMGMVSSFKSCVMIALVSKPLPRPPMPMPAMVDSSPLVIGGMLGSR